MVGMSLRRVVASAIAVAGVIAVGCEKGGDGDVMPSPSQRPGTPPATAPPSPYQTVTAAEHQANLAACSRAQERSRQPDGTSAVKVYFHCGPDGEDVIRELERSLPTDQVGSPLRFALIELMAGPTEQEQADGLSSFWSNHQQLLRSVRIVNETRAVVDFDDAVSAIGNISTSTGGKMFGDELDATVFQFPKVQTIVYTLEGNCEAFTEIFQSFGCPPSKRPLRPTIIPVR
jgi:hypothetical protein